MVILIISQLINNETLQHEFIKLMLYIEAFVWENDVVTWGFEKFSRKLERILQW